MSWRRLDLPTSVGPLVQADSHTTRGTTAKHKQQASSVVLCSTAIGFIHHPNWRQHFRMWVHCYGRQVTHIGNSPCTQIHPLCDPLEVLPSSSAVRAGAVKPMAPNAARARKAARRAQEEAAAAEMAIHTTPSAAAAIKRAEQSEAAAAKDEERAEHEAHVSQVKGEAKREGVDLTAYCVVCGTRDATSVAQHVQSTRAGSSPSCGHPEGPPACPGRPAFRRMAAGARLRRRSGPSQSH